MKKTLLLIYLKAATSRNPRKNTTRFNGLLALFVMVIGMGESWGQIVTFDFAGAAGSETTINATTTDLNLGTCTISRGSGLTASGNSDRFNATNWAITSIANAVNGNDYMEFTITPNNGFQFSVSSIVIQLQRSGTGLTAIALRNSVNNFASNLDTEKGVADNTATQSFTFTFNQIDSTSPITYRLYGYAESLTGSGGPGDGTSSDIIVNGSVTSTLSVSNPIFTASNLNATSNTLSATANANNNNIIVAQNATASFGTPIDTNSYNVGSSLPTSGTIIYNGSASGITSHTGLTANTQYFYKAWSYDGSNNYSSGTTASATTKIADADVTNNAVSVITATTATTSGTIASNGTSSLITTRGVAYATTTTPTTPTVSSGTGFGTFTPNLTALTPQTLYYVRAFGTNGGGTTFASTDVSFRTLSSPPTAQPTSISATATSYSSITFLLTGDATYPASNATNRGYVLLYGTTAPSLIASPNGLAPSSAISSGDQIVVTETNSPANPSISGLTATGLTPNTTYYLLVIPYTWDGNNASTYNYLTSGARTASVTTLSELPTLTSSVVSSITTSSALAGGTVTNEGISSISAKGVVWSTSTSPSISLSTKTNEGPGIGSFSSTISSLSPNTKYYYRAYATNGYGTNYGNEINFTSLHNAPISTIASSINSDGFTANWTAPTGGGSEVFTYTLQYSTSPTFLSGNASITGISGLNQVVTDLVASTTYYYRVLVNNAGGDGSWSTIQSLTTAPQAPGILLLEDNFEASNGTSLTALGYTAHSSSGISPIKINSSGLSYTNFGSTNIGNAAIINANGEDVNRTFTSQSSGSTTYCAFMINVTSANTAGDYIINLGPSIIATEYRCRLFIKNQSGILKLGISASGNTGNYASNDYSFNTTYLIVLKHFFNGTSQTSSIYINPTLLSEPATPNATETSTTNLSTNIGSVAIRQSSTNNVVIIDGLRIATNWGAVTGNPQYSDNTTIAAGNYNSITTYDGSAPSISGNVNVYNELSILGGTLTTNNTLTLKSNADGTARVSEVGSGGAITGNVTVERYIPAKRGWRLLTAPLKGSSSNTIGANWQGTANEGLLLFSPATYQSTTMTGYTTGGGSPNIWNYDNGWQKIANISTETMFNTNNSDTKAYLVFATGPHGSNTIANTTSAEATTLKPLGQLITGSVAHSLTADQFKLLPNPYASPLNTEGLATSNSDTTIYMVDPTLNTVGGYFAYDGSNWTPTTPSASDAYIQSGQGFFVKNASNTTFTIAESHKVSGNSNTWFERTTTDTSVDKIRVLLYKQINADWQLADGILAVNSASGNNEVDAADTDKMTNFNENIAFKNGATHLSIEYRGLPAAGTLQSMQLTGTTAQAYQMRLKTENYSNSNLTPYLENIQTGVLTAIPTDGSEVVVPFTGMAATSAAPDSRFRIVYQAPLSADDLNSLVVGVYPNPVNEGLFTIELANTNSTASYTLTNLLGQEVQKGTLMSLTNAIAVQDLSKGVYLLQINQEGKRFSTKLMIK
jgi:hypothetical protein